MAVDVGAIAGSIRRMLGSGLRGEVIYPGDVGYDAARAVFNGMIDRRPLAVVRRCEASDVVRCVELARRHDLPLTVRGGGHSVAGNAVRDGAVMLDLSGMKAIQVDPETRTARAEPGLTLAEFDQATQGSGLRPRSAWCRDRDRRTHPRRRAGLAQRPLRTRLRQPHLRRRGDRRRTPAPGQRAENEDLFWGIRGGGGNFGVVTSFEYQLHPVDRVLAGGLTYPLSAAPQVLRFYDEFVRSAPDELSTAVSLGMSPAGEPVVSIAVCYCGPVDEGERVLRPLRTFQPPVEDVIQPMPYPVLQRARDEGFPSGRLHYWKSGWLRDLTDAAIATLMEFLPQMPSSASSVGLQQMHGAASRVPQRPRHSRIGPHSTTS